MEYGFSDCGLMITDFYELSIVGLRLDDFGFVFTFKCPMGTIYTHTTYIYILKSTPISCSSSPPLLLVCGVLVRDGRGVGREDCGLYLDYGECGLWIVSDCVIRIVDC